MAESKKMHKMPNGKMMAGATHKEAKMKKYASGGMPMVEKNGQKVPAFAADGKGKMACGGKVKKYAAGGGVGMEKVANKVVKGHEKRMHGMAKGGPVDGCAKKGKTKGKMV